MKTFTTRCLKEGHNIQPIIHHHKALSKDITIVSEGSFLIDGALKL